MTNPLRSVPTPTTDYPWQEWEHVRNYVDTGWDPMNNPHHSIIGLTGSGKSYLAINGILRGCCRHDRVLIVDTKGEDELVSTTGKPVKELPNRPWYMNLTEKEEKPEQHWYRLVVSDDPRTAKEQVFNALKRVYTEHNWVVYLDEIYDITHPRLPNLGLEPWVTQIYKKGRSRRVSIIAATQDPAWVPRIFYSGASWAWIGRIRDEQRQKRLLEIGGMAKQDLPIIRDLEERQWLMAASNGKYFARTTVKV